MNCEYLWEKSRGVRSLFYIYTLTLGRDSDNLFVRTLCIWNVVCTRTKLTFFEPFWTTFSTLGRLEAVVITTANEVGKRPPHYKWWIRRLSTPLCCLLEVQLKYTRAKTIKPTDHWKIRKLGNEWPMSPEREQLTTLNWGLTWILLINLTIKKSGEGLI